MPGVHENTTGVEAPGARLAIGCTVTLVIVAPEPESPRVTVKLSVLLPLFVTLTVTFWASALYGGARRHDRGGSEVVQEGRRVHRHRRDQRVVPRGEITRQDDARGEAVTAGHGGRPREQ